MGGGRSITILGDFFAYKLVERNPRVHAAFFKDVLDVRGDSVVADVQLRGDFFRAALPRIEQLRHLDFAAGKSALRKDFFQ